MPRGEYIDWETERDGMPLWRWCRGEHTRGASWTDIGAALGMKGDTVRKAVLRIERDLLDSTRMPRPKEQGAELPAAELPKTLPLRDAARAAWDAYAELTDDERQDMLSRAMVRAVQQPDLQDLVGQRVTPLSVDGGVVTGTTESGARVAFKAPEGAVGDALCRMVEQGTDPHPPDLSGIHPPVPVEPTEPVVQVIEHPGGIADGEHLIATQLSAQQRGVELLRTWREEDKAHRTLVDAFRDAQSEQRIAMLNELLDIERGAENEAWEVTAPERTVALPEDLARDALIAYAWVSAKPSRWDKAYDSRDAVETAEVMLREHAA